MDRLENPELDGWIPVRLFWQDQQPLIDWCYLGADRFTAPFFTETVDDCMRLPFNLIFRHQTPIEVLGHRHQTQPGLQPTGFRSKVAMNDSWRRRPGRHDCPEAALLPFTGSDQAPERGPRRVRRGWRVGLRTRRSFLQRAAYLTV